MQPSKAAERLLLLSLTLEGALEAEDWHQVNELLEARAALLPITPSMPQKALEELTQIEERMLTKLRARMDAVKVDLRNLNAAVRIANPYMREDANSSISLAG